MKNFRTQKGENVGPIVLRPALKNYIWGGKRLIYEFAFESEEPLAEAWMLSCHKNGACILPDGSLLCAETAKDISSVLIKIIDARDKLSLQVHPSEDYARQHEGDSGKTEAWYIIDCRQDSEIILGLSRDTSKEEVRRLVETEKIESICRKVKVRPGDAFLIEPGTIHAVRDGILLVEVQQSSDVTYRVFDYGRVGKDGKRRELHIDKALDVLNYSASQAKKSTADEKTGKTCFPENGFFNAYVCNTDEPLPIYNERKSTSVIVLDGKCSLLSGGETTSLQKGSSVIIPAGCKAELTQGAKLLITTAK